MLKELLVLLIGMVSYSVVGQSCTCDLTSAVCDINCCCDPDCTANDKAIFSSCIPVNENRLEEVCVSDSLLFSANGEYNAEGTAGGLFCIYKDNYQERNLFTNVAQTGTKLSFDTLASQHRSFSFQPSSQRTRVLENTYKNNDLIYIQFPNKRYGYLSQPSLLFSTRCTDQNPARFLNESSSRCDRIVTNLQTQCTSEMTWKAATFYNTFQVAPFPSFVITSEANVNSSLPSEAITLVVKKPLQCRQLDGSLSDCTFTDVPQPIYDTTSGCKNVLDEVAYRFGYETNGTTFIKNVDVSLVFKDIPINTNSFSQTFKTSFFDVSAVNKTNASLIIERSGNPGYIKGLPIRSGNLTTDADTKISQVTPLPINLLASSLAGTCANKATPLLFGVDYRSGCFIKIKPTMNVTECQQLQDNTYEVLLGQLPTHVATFGNSKLDTSEGWVQIINNPPTIKPDVSNGECINMITDTTFKVLFAKTGFFANPQNKLIGLQVHYGNTRTLHYQCYGTVCDSTREQNIEITQNVLFVDVTLPPQAEERSIPKFRSKAPNDFFYPFF